MDISKYTGYFHDGGLIDIRHMDNKIELLLFSAEMDPEDLREDIPLGQDDCITGILHLDGIKKITKNEQPFFGELKMEHQSGDIFKLEISTTTVILKVIWSDYKPIPHSDIDFSTIEIEADKIYWENKPDLVDPYW